MLDQFDTGYRSPDWDEREERQQRLDYHDIAVVIAAGEMKDQLWKTVRSMRRRDGPEHARDHVRNTLALLLRDCLWRLPDVLGADARLYLRPCRSSVPRGSHSALLRLA
jgi:hypothetical protein